MRKKTFTLAMAAIAAASVPAMLASCANQTSTQSEIARSGSLDFKTETYKASYTLKNSAQDYQRDKDVPYTAKATMLMPTSVPGEGFDVLRNAIMKTAFDSIGSDEATIAKNYFRKTASEIGYTPEATTDDTASDMAAGETIVNGFVQNVTSEILSYGVLNYIYAPGAAHGMSTTRYIVFDFDNGNVVSLSDILSAEGLEKLPATLKERATALESAIGPTELTALPSGNNFYISPDNNLVFVYQPYEIASYAQGTIAISVPAYTVSELMTDYGKTLFNFQ